MIGIEEFDKVQLRVGTVTAVSINKKARKPAYKVTLDFGPELGIKTSSAQLTELYQPEDLIGKQLICCVNLAPMHIGSVKSEVRILGTDSRQGVVLLTTMEPVESGDRIYGFPALSPASAFSSQFFPSTKRETMKDAT